MLTNSFNSIFSGSVKDRELRETKRAWDETEALWQSSPLVEGRMLLLLNCIEALTKREVRWPSGALGTAIVDTILEIIDEEPIGELEPLWTDIERSAEVAVSFRRMLARRRRWVSAFPDMASCFVRIVAGCMDGFLKSLPEFCFAEETLEEETFEVCLLDLLPDAVEVIHRFAGIGYQGSAHERELLWTLHEQTRINTLLASGMDPAASNPSGKLKFPKDHRGKSAAELAELYLRGTPFRKLLEHPIPFHISDTARFEHCHIVGGTGHGKTQLLQRMIHADLLKAREDGRSVVVIDSQGDLIGKLQRLELFSPDDPSSLANRLVLIDPADVEYPAALNLFDAHQDRTRDYSAADRERVLNGVVELYEMFFGAFLGAELTQKQGVVFKYLARLMLAIPSATIHTLMQIMEDGRPFKPYMDRLDGSARNFFETEFFHPSFAPTKKQVLRRLWGVLSTPAFERMFTQPHNKLDLFEAMNNGKIILVSTAKEFLKREGSQLFGRFFIVMLTQAALERSILPERLRRPVFVYVDEAQEYFDDNIETILSQARKYMLGFTAAHQTLDQLSPRLRASMFSNTSMKCAGGVSAKDARVLAEELRTTADFIEGMQRRGFRTEFAVWLKHVTGQAIRLSVPLGFLERQPTLDAEDGDELVRRNRLAYCGRLVDVPRWSIPVKTLEGTTHSVAQAERDGTAATSYPPENASIPAPTPPKSQKTERLDEPVKEPERQLPHKPTAADPGKGGREHRYLQALAKQLAEQVGLRAIIEAPLPDGRGQVDILLEREGVVAAIEISMSTPVGWEQANLRKCLDAGYQRIAVVLAKSKRTQASYKTALSEGLTQEELSRVCFLAPEGLPDFIAAVTPPAPPSEKIVKGYRVKVSQSASSPDEVKARQEALTRIIARSLNKNGR